MKNSSLLLLALSSTAICALDEASSEKVNAEAIIPLMRNYRIAETPRTHAGKFGVLWHELMVGATTGASVTVVNNLINRTIDPKLSDVVHRSVSHVAVAAASIVLVGGSTMYVVDQIEQERSKITADRSMMAVACRWLGGIAAATAVDSLMNSAQNK